MMKTKMAIMMIMNTISIRLHSRSDGMMGVANREHVGFVHGVRSEREIY